MMASAWAASTTTNFGGDTYNDGGFMNTQSTSKQGRDNKEPLSYLDINTIYNVLKFDDGVYRYENTVVSNCIVIGKLISVAHDTQKFTFNVSDGSCSQTLFVTAFIDDGNMPHYSKFIDGNIVQIYGTLKNYQGNHQIVVFNMGLVEEALDVVMKTHSLQCELFKLICQKGLFGLFGASGDNGKRLKLDTIDTNASNQFGASSSGAFDNMTKQVLNCIERGCNVNPDDKNGMHIDSICNQMSHLPKNKVIELIHFLNDEGHIYTTISDNHYHHV